MRIAFATHFPVDPSKPHGGVEAVVVNLARGLSALEGVELDIVTLDPAISSVQVSKWEGITLHRLPRKVKNELLNAVTTGRGDIKQYLTTLSPDIVHAHDTYGIMISGLDLPRVFTVHGFIYSDTKLSNVKFSYFRSYLWKWFELSGWKDQPNIISISPYVRERVSRISSAVIYDIDNPISSAFFDIPRNDTKPIIFSAAHLNPRKNPLRLIKAIYLLKNRGYEPELRLAGKITDQNYGRILTEYVRDNGLESNVKLMGVLSSKDIKIELSKASIFALVSHEENSPMGIEEAMAAGLPIITSNKCGMPYMVVHRESGYLVNENSEYDIAQKLSYLLEDDSLRLKMGAKSNQIAKDRFHVDVVSKRTFETYKEIISANHISK
jgi:glycosyltransferase involved in cell wall biosynthesis